MAEMVRWPAGASCWARLPLGSTRRRSFRLPDPRNTSDALRCMIVQTRFSIQTQSKCWQFSDASVSAWMKAQPQHASPSIGPGCGDVAACPIAAARSRSTCVGSHSGIHAHALARAASSSFSIPIRSPSIHPPPWPPAWPHRRRSRECSYSRRVRKRWDSERNAGGQTDRQADRLRQTAPRAALACPHHPSGSQQRRGATSRPGRPVLTHMRACL